MLKLLERMVLMMAMLWAQQIMLGKAVFADVPRQLKEAVRAPESLQTNLRITLDSTALLKDSAVYIL